MPLFRQQDVQTPHLQMPFKLGGINGAAFVNEQDSYEDVLDCVKAILAYPAGTNVAQPGFGIPDVLFRQITAAGIASGLQQAIRQWEPRSDIVVTENPVAFDELVRKVTVRVQGEN
jgi:phage baseplate assembly protein W